MLTESSELHLGARDGDGVGFPDSGLERCGFRLLLRRVMEASVVLAGVAGR
jgi:hypothetical protein